jgi:C_GCAxxG_C_C family probable redox protein
MWEANGGGDDSMLWAGTNFFGGIAGHQEGVCGAVSAIGVYLGFRYRSQSKDKEQVDQAIMEARRKTDEIVRKFKDKFGSIICIDLVGVDFSDPESARRFFEDNKTENRCPDYVEFAVEKLCELE